MFRLLLCGLFVCAWTHEETMDDKFHSLFKVVDKLLDYAKFDLQDATIAGLMAQLQDARTTIKAMNKTKHPSHFVASTYTRWGRSSCPGNATLVYEGFAAGAKYTEIGGAANFICLPQNPIWHNHTKTPKYFANIYGGEYETHDSIYDKLKEHEVPCAICRVPRSNIIMVPGTNVCYQDYEVEYEGYLMAGHPTHKAASEYVCVDGEAEQARNSSADNQNGKLFYFVRAVCGALKCPPYKVGDDLTCVVCSYSPYIPTLNFCSSMQSEIIGNKYDLCKYNDSTPSFNTVILTFKLGRLCTF